MFLLEIKAVETQIILKRYGVDTRNKLSFLNKGKHSTHLGTLEQ